MDAEILKQWEPRLNRAKAAIRKGGIIIARRRTGCSTALLQVIGEDHDGKAIVIVPSLQNADYLRKTYTELFPGKTVPIFRTEIPKGNTSPVYIDWLANMQEFDPRRVKAAILPIEDDISVQVVTYE